MSRLEYIQENIDISYLSAFKTKAVARYYFEIVTDDDVALLSEVFFFARESGLPVTIIAGGTNCLFAFDTYEGIFIRNRYVGHSEPYEHDGMKLINVHSGELSTTLAMKLYQNYSISTLIPWIGLPGTMGGACIGNAGCFGLEMSDILISARILDLETGEKKTYTTLDMCYQYRESILKGDPQYFVIDMTLRLDPRGNEYESYTPANLQSIRRLKQPPGLSCGSFFKNPRVEIPIMGKESLLGERGHTETWSAGKLIDEAGLKGTRVGGIVVSERHGNFFINDEKGTWQDVLTLRDKIKKGVKEFHNIDLQEEVRIIENRE